MGSLHAIQLLSKTAHAVHEERQAFSKEEILKKVNEIKYLSSQKKVPKLTLRKEIIHLENQLQGVMELERKFLREKNTESNKISGLKQQITTLKHRLNSVEDQDLNQKVNKLTYLLGEHLARKEVSKEVAVSHQPARSAPSEDNTARKCSMLQKRLEALRHELEIHKELGSKNPQELEAIEEKVHMLEEKIKTLQPCAKIDVPMQPQEERHEI